MRLPRFVDRSKLLLAVLLVLVVLGIAVTRQYGESWDELQFFKYADHALEAYSTWLQSGTVPLTGNTYDNYGPAYVMLVALLARLLGLFIPWITSDLRHLVYFATYVVGIWALYRLCERWLSRTAAFGATLLLATQPLFWGHAFISPKDIPFMAFFVLTLLLGFRMADSIGEVPLESVPPRERRTLSLVTSLWLLALVGLVAGTPLVHAWIEGLVGAAASGQGSILSRLTSHIRTTNAAAYVERYFVLYLRVATAVAVLASGALVFLWRRVPAAFGYVRSVAPAAAILGLTTSIRVLGPLAWIMVAAYALHRQGRKSVPALLVYAVVAAAIMYLTWPYLWPDPFGHFVESVRVMAEYPWQGAVLFDGTMFGSTELPRSYLPVLLGIQLTEPVWLLFAVGLALSIFDTVRRRPAGRALLLLTAVWFVLPLLAFVVTRSPLYDNFRQIIFILPPVFMMAGLVFEKVRRIPVQAGLIALVALPGIIDGARLHPYEYIYYNRFVGGEQGAFRKYELDYWGTSYREAADYVNRVAPANANIWVEGPAHLIQIYRRPDLKIYSTYEAVRAGHYDYVVALTRFNLDLQSYPSAPIVHVIQRDGALLTVIKKP
jgi:hypothetical protein